MSFTDMIKNSVLAEFSSSVSALDIVFSLILAFILGCLIVLVYKKTYSGVIYSKSFSLCIVLLSMVTAIVIRTITSNLALSLGMVGALSIVRFRTAIKEPTDTVFMFWAITMGIMAGAGLYLAAIIACIGIGILYIVGYSFGIKTNSQYLFIIKYDYRVNEEVLKKIKKLNKTKLKSKSITKNIVELTFEVEVKNNNTDTFDSFKDMEGVLSTNIISYQNDFGA